MTSPTLARTGLTATIVFGVAALAGLAAMAWAQEGAAVFRVMAITGLAGCL